VAGSWVAQVAGFCVLYSPVSSFWLLSVYLGFSRFAASFWCTRLPFFGGFCCDFADLWPECEKVGGWGVVESVARDPSSGLLKSLGVCRNLVFACQEFRLAARQGVIYPGVDSCLVLLRGDRAYLGCLRLDVS